MELTHDRIRLKVPKVFKKVKGFKRVPGDEFEGNILLEDKDQHAQPDDADEPPTCFHKLFQCLAIRMAPGLRRKKRIERSVDLCEQMSDKLTEKIKASEERLTTVNTLLAKNVKAKNRKMAKHYLTQKKRLERTIASYMRYKNELEAMTISLNETEDQTDFIASFKSAQGVLKQHNKTLPLESFESFAEDFDEARQDMDDFHEGLKQRNEQQYGDLDEELEALFNDSSSANNGNPPDTEAQMIASMPRPPTTLLKELDDITLTPDELEMVRGEEKPIAA